jgi:hypothetical protein
MLTWLTETEISVGAAILCGMVTLLLLAAASELHTKINALRTTHSRGGKEPTTDTATMDAIGDTTAIHGTAQDQPRTEELSQHEQDVMLTAAKVHAVRAYVGEGLAANLREDYDEQTTQLLKAAPDLENHGDIVLLAAFEIINDLVAKYITAGRTDLDAFLNDWHESVVEAHRMEVELNHHG